MEAFVIIFIGAQSMRTLIYNISSKEILSNNRTVFNLLLIYTAIGHLMSYPILWESNIFLYLLATFSVPFFAFFAILEVRKNG